MDRQVREVGLRAVRGAAGETRTDLVACEEPLEIRVETPAGVVERIAVTMRTPGHDLELALGFLLGEGVIDGPSELGAPPAQEQAVLEGRGHVVTVRLRRSVDLEALRRNFYTTSSCGVCGKAAIERVELAAPALEPGPRVPAAVVRSLPAALRAAQPVFDLTGGLHATGLFRATGELVVAREDVGRHNALDKVLGHALLAGAVPLATSLLLVSGRASFELVQKAAMAGAPILCAVSAPSSLAVDAALRLGLTLVAFLRGETFQIYAHPERLELG
ncbi:MAG: formate dehydrogenase accessory sulfurtransferase FdhD [Polyangiaceae bacterium]|nr:formate dehydrogenase accessory sulfurtransferase FdhD [Polyangiaceae bacterium]